MKMTKFMKRRRPHTNLEANLERKDERSGASAKWIVLTEGNVIPAEVLQMQMEDKTLERYWKMAREETFEPDGKEGILFMIINGTLYRKVDRVFENSVRLKLVVPVILKNIVLNAA